MVHSSIKATLNNLFDGNRITFSVRNNTLQLNPKIHEAFLDVPTPQNTRKERADCETIKMKSGADLLLADPCWLLCLVGRLEGGSSLLLCVFASGLAATEFQAV